MATVATAALLVSATSLVAHDFWLVPGAFHVAAGSRIEVRGQTSSRFPTSESAVALDRVADARVISASQEARVREISPAGTSLLLRHRPGAPGQRIVAVRLHPRSVRESAEGFRRYLVAEGASEALERYQREGRLSSADSVTRRYAKYAKTVVEVGGGGPRAFGRVVGHPLEFVPLDDPASLRAGDSVRVRILYRGKPLAGAHVRAGAVPASPPSAYEAAAGRGHDQELTSDTDGVVRIASAGEGMWNVRAVHVVPAEARSGADWDTHWASLVFSVAGERPATSRAPTGERRAASDSAEVAAVVDRFHRALATGDSATALAMLAPDAVVLESGGAETPAEYRAHHLPADIAFARAVPRQRGPIRVQLRGEVAWASSTSVTRGEFRGRAVNSQGAELMVLVRDGDGWKIAAIHWSSRALRP